MAIKVTSFKGATEAIIKGFYNDVVPYISKQYVQQIHTIFEQENTRMIEAFNNAGNKIAQIDLGYVPATTVDGAPVLDKGLGNAVFGPQRGKGPAHVDLGNLGRGLEDRYITVTWWSEYALNRREVRDGTRREGAVNKYHVVVQKTDKHGNIMFNEKEIEVTERKTQDISGPWYYWKMVERGTHMAKGFVQVLDSPSGGKVAFMVETPFDGGIAVKPKHFGHTYYMRHAKERMNKKIISFKPDIAKARSELALEMDVI